MTQCFLTNRKASGKMSFGQITQNRSFLATPPLCLWMQRGNKTRKEDSPFNEAWKSFVVCPALLFNLWKLKEDLGIQTCDKVSESLFPVADCALATSAGFWIVDSAARSQREYMCVLQFLVACGSTLTLVLS